MLTDEAVAIFAHADDSGALRNLVRSWRFERTKAVLLLFCGSGAFDLISGPFTDGVAQRIRRQLGKEGIVVSNRLPVSIAEANRLLLAVKNQPAGRPLASVITAYLAERMATYESPFNFPWFII